MDGAGADVGCTVRGSRLEMFLSKAMPVTESGCWLWTACIHVTGYGRFGMGGYEIEYSHRAAWRLFIGEIPDGQQVCHKCDVRSCVNPDHLFLGSQADNMRDASRKGRIVLPRENYASDETHQPAKLTNENVIEIRSNKTCPRILAARFGVCVRTIYAAKARHSFRDVA